MKSAAVKILIAGVIALIILGGIFAYFKYFSRFENTSKKEGNADNSEQAGLSDEQLKKEIGQMILMGFRGTKADESSDVYNMIKDVEIGGVMLFDFDIPSKSYPRNILNFEQLKKLISGIQKYSAIPLFVAVDAEGGNVNRLNPKYGFSAIASAEKMGKDKTLKTVTEESVKLSSELKELGFNMNLAPVVDVNVNPKSPVIGALGRSFSPDPQEVIRQARVFMENHYKNNIIAVAKHFPGHGSADKDSHLGLVDITSTYKPEELLPYKKLNEDGLLKAVMVAHVINRKVDKDYPATLSPLFLQDILRNQIGFKGIIISDDMDMAAISDNYGLGDALVLAVNAGVDVIAVSNNSPKGYNKNKALEIRDIIFNAVKSGKISEQRINESYSRIMEIKKEFGIIQQQ